MPPRISVFPEVLLRRARRRPRWRSRPGSATPRRSAAKGVEHYDGFFRSFTPRRCRSDRRAPWRETGQVDVDAVLLARLHPSRRGRAARGRSSGRRRPSISRSRLGARFCRTLSGQRYPGLTRARGHRADRRRHPPLARLRRARAASSLCMENHYKDGSWRYPEFAQPEDIFLEILDRIDSPHFGVQYDPSNAIVGGYDPIRFLERVRRRVVTMHASDRFLAPGATLDDLRAADGAAGYADDAAARRDRQGAQRLRRDLPAAGRGRLQRLDFGRGRHERARRAARGRSTFLKQKRRASTFDRLPTTPVTA